MESRDCVKCGTEFQIIQKHQIYCSSRCRKAVQARRRRRNPEYSKRRNKRAIPGKKRRYEIKKQIILDYKISHPCSCGESHPACLVFHHRDPKTKRFAIAHTLHHGVSLTSLQDEMAKCDVICANCHLKFHYQEPVPQDIRIKPDVAGL